MGEIAGEVAGTAVWFRTYTPWTARPTMWVSDMYVRPEYRRRGVARALGTTLAARCASGEFCRLDWKMRTDNDSARAFYQGVGATPWDSVLWSLRPDAITS